MPHKVNNDSNSTLASRGSTGDSVASEVRSESLNPIQSNPQIQANTRSPAANPVRKPPVIIHNKGGQIYDETRPSDWDKQRWK